MTWFSAGPRRLWPVPAARPPRRALDVRRLLLLQQRGDRGGGDRAATGERVAILDVDFHHGNGTQQIFWRRGDVRYVSIHADPDRQYPYFLGRADETGEDDGAGENLNIPLHAGASDADYLEATERALEASRTRRDRSSWCRSGSTRTVSTRSATSR